MSSLDVGLFLQSGTQCQRSDIPIQQPVNHSFAIGDWWCRSHVERCSLPKH